MQFLTSAAPNIYKCVSLLYPFRRSSGGHSTTTTTLKSTECWLLDHDLDEYHEKLPVTGSVELLETVQ